VWISVDSSGDHVAKIVVKLVVSKIQRLESELVSVEDVVQDLVVGYSFDHVVLV